MSELPNSHFVARARQRVGASLRKRYRVERLIGIGGMGAVYAGLHRNGHPVAIKILHERLSPDSEIERLFRREALLANTIKHPGVVPVIDDDVTSDGCAFLVMPLLTGETLRATCERMGGKIPVQDAVAVAVKVLAVLAVAHAAKIVHRDIKPENVFLTSEGEVRILDFGIARFFETNDPASATRSGRAVGTPAFMAPEQALGRLREIDGRTDIWAVGATLFSLISGRVVHEGATGSEVIVAAATRPALQLMEVAPSTPAPVCAVVDRALAFDRDARWQSAEEMSRALVDAYRDAYASALEDRAPIVPPNIDDDEHAAPRASERADAWNSTTGFRERATRTSPMDDGQPRRPRVVALVTVAAPMFVLALGATWWARSSSAGRAESIVAPKTSCTSNLACGSPEHPAICRHSDGTCVPIESEDCFALADQRAVTNDDTVWIGALFPRKGRDAHDLHDADAIDLARRDFAQTMGSVAVSRPFGVVSCDDSVDARRAATHLAKDLHVPAVIGYRSGVEAVDLETSILGPHGVISIDATSTNPLVTRVPQSEGQPRLAWRTTFDASEDADALASFVANVLVPRMRANGELGPRERPRIANVHARDAAGDALAAAFASSLVVDGKSAAADEHLLRDETYGLDAADDDAAFDAVAKDLVALAPHVVVFTAVRGVTGHVLPTLEANWPATKRYRPLYVNFANVGPSLVSFAGNDGDRLKRVFGISTVSTSTAHARFLNRFTEVFSSDGVTRTSCPDTAYDAFYALAYATYAIPREAPVTGVALSRAFSRLGQPGRAIDVGMAGIFDAYGELSNGRNIDLTGASGALDLDPRTGNAAMDRAFVCLIADPKTHVTSAIDSGLVYSMRKRELLGEMRCE